MRKLIDFIETYAAYREQHGRIYSARIAFGVAFRGLPF